MSLRRVAVDHAARKDYRGGRSLLTAPRTDPYMRHYRIRLVPWMVTTHPHVGNVLRLVRPAVRATWRPGAVSGPVATARRAPWSAPFPPPTPPTADRCLCSPASAVLWGGLTPRKRTCRHCASRLLRPIRFHGRGGCHRGLSASVRRVSSRACGLRLRGGHSGLAVDVRHDCCLLLVRTRSATTEGCVRSSIHSPVVPL